MCVYIMLAGVIACVMLVCVVACITYTHLATGVFVSICVSILQLHEYMYVLVVVV